MCSLNRLTFQSDELVFHPQSAEDNGWNVFAADKKYKVYTRCCLHGIATG